MRKNLFKGSCGLGTMTAQGEREVRSSIERRLNLMCSEMSVRLLQMSCSVRQSLGIGGNHDGLVYCCQRDTIANVHFCYSHGNMKLHNANLNLSQKFIFPIIKLIAPYVKENVSPFICARPWDLIPSTTQRSRGAEASRLLRVS